MNEVDPGTLTLLVFFWGLVMFCCGYVLGRSAREVPGDRD